MRDLTTDEKVVIQTLGDAFNEFQQLPEVHPWDSEEFMHAIHAAQSIVLARPALETYDPQEGATSARRGQQNQRP
jgi:hypothetical protein